MTELTARTRGLARQARGKILRWAFEGRSPVDTSVTVPLDQLGLEGPGRREYKPSGWRALSRGLRGIPIDDRDVFVDYGAGLGRVVAQAAQRRFGRAIGLELSEELATQARHYLAGQKRTRCPAEIVTGDAVTWELPDDATVLYLNNSFTGEVLDACLGQIGASLKRRPRTVWLLYVNPSEPERIAGTGLFQTVRRVSNRGDHADDIIVYRTTDDHH
jgi:Histone methylation protein DOT1